MRRGTAIAGLGMIAALYVLRAASLWSADDFGYLHDDTLYVSSARSLAEGRGYRIPSLPNAPAQTKYPVLYPWLLSILGSDLPELGQALERTFVLNVACGCLFLLGAFSLLRQLGAGKVGSLLVTLLCSLHPMMIDLARMPLSDLAFMAFAIWALVSASRDLEIDEDTGQRFRILSICTAATSMLAVATRSIGGTVGAGIFLAATLRRAHQQAWFVAASCAIPLAAGLWWASSSGDIQVAGQPDGYRQTLLFYTSYAGFWKLSVPDWATLVSQVRFNLVELLKTPAMLCFFLPVGGFQGGFWQAIAVATSFLIVKGAFAGRSPGQWHAIHFTLLFHIPILLLWNYTLMERLLLLFLPLFLWGAAREAGGLVRRAQEVWRKRAPWAERLAAALITAAVWALTAFAGYRCLWEIPRHVAAQSARRSALMAHKKAAYEWIVSHTAPGDRFVAYEDVLLFLHTGRQAIRPISPSTAAFYLQDKEPLERDLAGISDTAIGTGARYWLHAEDDYHLNTAEDFLMEATRSLLAAKRLVFQSGDVVRIYDISSITGVATPDRSKSSLRLSPRTQG